MCEREEPIAPGRGGLCVCVCVCVLQSVCIKQRACAHAACCWHFLPSNGQSHGGKGPSFYRTRTKPKKRKKRAVIKTNSHALVSPGLRGREGQG